MSQMGSGTWIHAFMISNLDYSDSLPAGLFQVPPGKRKDSLYKSATPEILSVQSLVSVHLCLEIWGLAAC